MPSPQHDQMAMVLSARPEELAPLTERRQGYDGIAALFPLANDIEVEVISAGGVPADWVRAPGADRERALLYFHGGGYIIGSRNSHRELASRLSRAAGLPVLLPEYRLAPEAPYPAAVDDAVASYRWLLEQGLDASRLAIGGDSAGGGLTLSCLISLRDAGLPLPAAAVLLSPWVDLACTGDSAKPGAVSDPVCRLAELQEMAELYAGDRRSEPLASPLGADLHGLPPLLVQVGTAEVLLDDAVRVTEKLRAAGVPVELEQGQDLMHVYQQFAATSPEAAAAVERLGAFIRGALQTA